MFVAGTDTSFITLDWGMTELIMNPRVMKKAQDEVRSVVRDRRQVLESDLPQLHYIKAVIKEIFRLHPPAPVLLPRESTEDVKIDGYDIPSKTRIFVNVWAIGRDPDSWTNLELFEPERFVGQTYYHIFLFNLEFDRNYASSFQTESCFCITSRDSAKLLDARY